MSANLYETKNDGEFFHIHGSLEASTTLKMIGLEPYRPDLTDYHDIIKVIESQVRKFTTAELEDMNRERRQAGVTAYKYEDFIKTPHVSNFSLSIRTADTLILDAGKAQCTGASVEGYPIEGKPASHSIPGLFHGRTEAPRRHQGS